MTRRALTLAASVVLLLATAAFADNAAPPTYHIYAGNTHAHTSFTWSHGDQWAKPAKPAAGGGGDAAEKKEALPVDASGAQRPPKTAVLRPDWETHQGPPAAHFALAKASGYDFYCVTDHSQEADLQPPAPDNPKWLATAGLAPAAG